MNTFERFYFQYFYLKEYVTSGIFLVHSQVIYLEIIKM